MRLPAGTGAKLGFLLAIAVLLGSGGLSYYNVRTVAENQGRVAHSYAVISSLRELEATLVRAESTQRAYLITNDPSYRETARSTVDMIPTAHGAVKRLVSDNPSQVERLKSLAGRVETRLSTLAEAIALRDQGTDAEVLKFVASGKGSGQMDAINDQIHEIEDAEQELLTIRQRASENSLNTTIALLAVTTLLGLGLVGIAYTLTAREVKVRQQAADDLAAANADLEERVRKRTTDLAAAIESLQRSNRELEQFASVASHDLQEPLRKIQAFGDRLQERCAPELGEQGRQYVDRMQAAAVRMRNLIDSLLNYSRVTTKAQPFAPVDLGQIAREVASDLETRIRQTGARVELGELGTIEADAVQMRQLLQNLIANALKFSRPGEAPVVRIRSRSAGRNNGNRSCEITVSDNGIGFEEAYLDRIFDVFQRLHGRQEYEGTGMGLAICRRIVERHGGSITAKSAPDEGAAFIVTLPERQRKEKGDI